MENKHEKLEKIARSICPKADNLENQQMSWIIHEKQSRNTIMPHNANYALAENRHIFANTKYDWMIFIYEIFA